MVIVSGAGGANTIPSLEELRLRSPLAIKSFDGNDIVFNCFQQLPLLTLAAQRACNQSRESLLGRQSRKHSWKQSLENNLDMIASRTDTKMRSKQMPLVSCLEAWALQPILLGWVLFVCCEFALCSTSAARVPKLS